MVCERQQSQIPESENPTGGCLSSKINACRRQRTSPLPSRTSSLMTRYPLPPLYPRRNQITPLLSPVLLSQPSPLSLHLSSVSRCESPDIQTRLVMLALASIHHYHSRLRYGSCSLSHFPFLLPSFTFTKTLLTPHGLISSTIFIKVFTLNELDASLHLYCLS